MKTAIWITIVLALISVGSANEPDDAAGAIMPLPKILRITGRVDGSGRILFAPGAVRYVHKHWQKPAGLRVNGEAWTRLDQTPARWREFARGLDLTRARVVDRTGRDMIAIERTATGFDLYLCDSPSGAADYAITLAIPRRARR